MTLDHTALGEWQVEWFGQAGTSLVEALLPNATSIQVLLLSVPALSHTELGSSLCAVCPLTCFVACYTRQ